MILKHADDRSADISKLQALLTNTLTATQRKAIEKEIHNVRRGAAGEKEAAHYLDAFLYDRHTVVLHDIRLVIDGRISQIDHLLLTPARTAVVIETKNFSGRLSCNDRREWSVWYGQGRGQGYAIPSPIEQARSHARNLRRWMTGMGWDVFPSIEALVMVPPTCSLPKFRDDEEVKIIKADHIARHWDQLFDNLSPLKVLWRAATMLSAKSLVTLGEAIIDQHVPATYDWTGKFGIVPDRMLPAASPTRSDLVVAAAEEVILAPSPEAIPAAIASPPIASSWANGIQTPFGVVGVKRVSDGRYALRHSGGAELADYLKIHVAVLGQWQPRYQNWLVAQDNLPMLASSLTGSDTRQR